ncbi:MAG: hypothetical protein U9O20_02590 [Patescibacteria group bacterium]|nr:hypothetical protein [Patescibacteria group bacterium]
MRRKFGDSRSLERLFFASAFYYYLSLLTLCPFLSYLLFFNLAITVLVVFAIKNNEDEKHVDRRVEEEFII